MKHFVKLQIVGDDDFAKVRSNINQVLSKLELDSDIRIVDDNDRLYSLLEIEQNRGIKVSTLKKLIYNGEISVVKVGNKNFVLESTIKEFIWRNTIRLKSSK